MPSLTRTEAVERAELLTVASYEIDLDLAGGPAGFHSTTRVRFGCARPGASTFVELRPRVLRSVRLNGQAVDPARLVDNRLALTGLAADNELVVEAEMAYSNTGEGLHRFVDPADGGIYLYAMSFLDDGQRIFACFDQPDLKAPVTLRVTADPQWTVRANGAGEQIEPGRWEFAPTPPLATYFVTLVAGAYHGVHTEHDGIPFGFFCRASLAEHLDRDIAELHEITAACFDRYHELFDVRYPFGKYDQVFAPEFNAGAMENPGCVVLRDEYVFRSAVTDSMREQRATTIAHEMAHMWFGDLVTMRWWDDLWLNEAFAEFLGTQVTAEATRFRQAWTKFGIERKLWGYAADQRSSTHPVAPAEVADAAAGLLNFDGISYAKGAAALRQLVAWLGPDAFFTGLRAHFARHAYGNATLADLIGALGAASDRDVAGWADRWLRRAEVNTLAPEFELDASGRYATFRVLQTAPPRHPTLRPHRLGVGRYDRVGTAVVARPRIDVDIDGARTDLPALVGEPAAALVLLNDGDLTYAKVRLDEASLAAVPTMLPGLPDSLSRAVVWSTVLNAVRDAALPAPVLADLLSAALPAEPEVVVVEDVLTTATRLLDRYLAGARRQLALELVAEACARIFGDAEPDDPRLLAAVQGFIATSTDVPRLRGWLRGNDVPAGITVDAELRWQVLARLSALGAAGETAVAAELASDRSASGAQWAARCRASRPDPVAKAEAWRVVVADTTRSNRLVEAAAEGFWDAAQAELTAPYVERYFAEMPRMATRRTPWATARLATLAFPRYAVDQETGARAAALLGRDDLHPMLRRSVQDAADDLARALAARRLTGEVATPAA